MSAIGPGSVNTTWKYGAGSNSASRSSSHSLAAAPWHPHGELVEPWAVPVAAAIVGDDRVGAIFAARNMTAEGRRAAALDCTHHLQLAEAHMTRVGATPRRAEVAEDIRDLQSWTGDGRRPLKPVAAPCLSS